MARHQQSTARCQIFLLLVAFGALALLVSTQTLTGQVRGGISLVPKESVYTLTFSGAVTSQPTTAKVVLWPPTSLRVRAFVNDGTSQRSSLRPTRPSAQGR